MTKFTNLHQHSMYSLLDSIAKVDDMIKKAKELGYEALCISDHGVIYNAPETYISCKENNIGYIYACELYICDDRFEKDNNNRYYHLLAMAYNEEGRINLNKIITDAYKNGFYYKPRTDFQFLSEHAEGLIISSACMAGEVSRSIINNDLENAINVIEKYKSVFKENYYLEVQSHDVEEQLALNRKIIDLAKQTNTPYIITNDSHYINKEDAEIHSLFIMNAKDSEVGEIYKDCYMQSDEDVINICSKTMSSDEIITAFDNISKIVSQCIGVELPIKKAEIPMPSLPQGFNNEYDYLRFLVYQGFKEHGLDKKKNKQEYIDRIEYELDALHRMHYDRYLLNIRDQLEGVERVGLGRGSSAGSVVCWLIGLTKIDSLKYDLYFERFVDVGQLKLIEDGLLSKDKLKTPDIDTDVSTSERQKTVEKLLDKYGSDYVCAIGTLNMTWAKSSIKDIARVLGVEASIANEITKTIESMDLTEDVINNEIDSKYKNMYPRLFQISSKITGIARSMSVHASGKIVSDRDLSYYAPIAILNNEQTIMCDMNSVDLFGLLKSDILGLRTLDVIFDTLKMIKKDYSYIDPNLINLNDKKIFKMFGEGKTDSIFQMASTGMRATLKDMKPDNIEDLTAVNAMFRPGPMANIPHYIKRKHGQEEVEYLHPDLEPILKNTFGIMCYQEQVIELGRYAGLNNPDDLRVATAKKKPAMLEKVKPEFISGLMKKRWTILQIETIWDELLAYAQYSFNKSHSLAYSLTAYQTMFLHYYHPLEFWAASLNSVAGKTEDLTEFMSAILNEGINLHVPTYKDINDICFVKDGKIFIGTNIIKGLSARIAHEAEWIKKINVTKDNFVDLLIYNEENAETKIGKTTMTILAKVGFFDNVAKREWLIDIIDQFNNGKGLKYSAKLTDKTKAARLNALREYAKSSSPEQARIRDILGWETDYFGVPLSKFAGMPSDYAYIMSIEKSKYTTRDGGASYIFMTYGIADGKVRKLMYNKNTTVFEGGIIQLKKIVEKSAAGKPYKTPVLYEYKKLT